MLAPFRNGLALMRCQRRALGILLLTCLGAFALGILATWLVPQLRPGGLGALDAGAGAPGIGNLIADSYRSGNVVLAAAVTFAVNLVSASLLQTTLPSLVVPLAGTVVTVVRAFAWGILFTPIGAADPDLLVHWVTLGIEGAAYLLVGFAAYVHGRMVLTPGRFEISGRRRGYRAGLRATRDTYAWVVLLLAVGASYEAVTVIHVIA